MSPGVRAWVRVYACVCVGVGVHACLSVLYVCSRSKWGIYVCIHIHYGDRVGSGTGD